MSTREASGIPATADARARALWACQEHAREAAEILMKDPIEEDERLEARLAVVANRYWPFYEFSSGTHEKIQAALRRERPFTWLAWAGKVLLAVLVAYPGHVAMGEMLGYPAYYGFGFKAFLTTWPIVAVLLLAAELLFIRGVVEIRFANDATDYLFRGYNPGHYDRGYQYRRPDEIARTRLGYTFYACGGILALADLAFNVSYMWDLTGQATLAVLAGGFFTALLVGLAVLIANVYDYHHVQLVETKRSAEHIEPGRGYVPVEAEALVPGAPAPEALSAGPPAPEDSGPERSESSPAAAEPVPGPSAAMGPAPGPAASDEAAGLSGESRVEVLPVESAPEPPPPRRKLPPPTQLKALKTGESFLLDDDNTVGRGAGNSIRLDDPSVAATHARLTWVGRWELVDLGSKGGTYVKGSRLQPDQPTPVSVGTAIRFGTIELLLDVHIGLPR